MIKTLELQNFQSHKKTEIEFSDGVNVIVGSSDSGKTALIRALKWVVMNRPLGNDFQSNWGGETSVKITTKEGVRISRKQDVNGTDKEYLISSIETPLRAFGTEVPKEITECLNLDETNLQEQLDSPFLLTSTSGDVAKHFNKIAHLEKIDIGISNVKKWCAQINSDIKYKANDLKEKEKALETYVYLDKFEIEVESLEITENLLNSTIKKRKELSDLARSLQLIDSKLEELQDVISIEPYLDSILSMIKDKKEINDGYQILLKLYNSIKKINEGIVVANKLISAEESVESLLQLYKDRESLVANKDRLNRVYQNAKTINNNIVEAEKRYKQLHDTFEANFPDVCPLCNTVLK